VRVAIRERGADMAVGKQRAQPPEDISPREFFTRWMPETVAMDEGRRRKLGATEATLVFELEGEGGGSFTVRVHGGSVEGSEGKEPDPDLRVSLDMETWRALNRGTLAAPEAVLRRRLKLKGDFLLGLKLHLILG